MEGKGYFPVADLRWRSKRLRLTLSPRCKIRTNFRGVHAQLYAKKTLFHYYFSSLNLANKSVDTTLLIFLMQIKILVYH